MSLNPCPDCEHPLSPYAAFCPRCGRPGDGDHSLSTSLRPIPLRVVVEDVHIGFWSLVGLMVKTAIAAIPALVILMFIGGFIWATLLASFRP